MRSSRSERIGWYFYDWANSAFSTTVITVFLGPYLTTIARNASDSSGFINVLGFEVADGAYFPFVVTLSVIGQIFTLPLLGAVADYTNRKKMLLSIFAVLGALATMSFYFLQGTAYLFGGIVFIVANICFGASIVMYNSFLNDIAEPEKRNSVSSVGWAFGYIGGGIVLAANLALFANARSLGLDESLAVRISLCSAGLWWMLFSIIPMITLKVREPLKAPPENYGLMKIGFVGIYRTLKEIRHYKQTLLFLAAYIFFNDGVQAVIVLASQFGQEEIGLSLETLTTVILMVQFIAFAGALIFNLISKVLNTKPTVLICIAIWAAAVFYAYYFLYSAYDFYILGIIIGLVMGGIQALSRSMFSQLIPTGKEAEYFSLYEISERGTSWIGPLIFGIMYQLTSSYRTAILSLIILFVIGFVLLLFLNFEKGKKDALSIKMSLE